MFVRFFRFFEFGLVVDVEIVVAESLLWSIDDWVLEIGNVSTSEFLLEETDVVELVESIFFFFHKKMRSSKTNTIPIVV